MGRLRRVGERRLLPCRRCTDVERRGATPRICTISTPTATAIVGRFSTLADRICAIGQSPACHAEFLGRKAREVEDFNWASVGLDVVTAKTKYPEPKAQAS
jgi:hypothetical protein